MSQSLWIMRSGIAVFSNNSFQFKFDWTSVTDDPWWVRIDPNFFRINVVQHLLNLLWTCAEAFPKLLNCFSASCAWTACHLLMSEKQKDLCDLGHVRAEFCLKLFHLTINKTSNSWPYVKSFCFLKICNWLAIFAHVWTYFATRVVHRSRSSVPYLTALDWRADGLTIIAASLGLGHETQPP